MHIDPGSTPRLLKTRLEQRARDETGGSREDTLHRLAGRILRIAALEIVTDLCVQAADRERGRYIQVCLDRYRTGWKFVCDTRDAQLRTTNDTTSCEFSVSFRRSSRPLYRRNETTRKTSRWRPFFNPFSDKRTSIYGTRKRPLSIS